MKRPVDFWLCTDMMTMAFLNIRNLKCFPTGNTVLPKARPMSKVAEYFNFQRAIVGSPYSVNERFARQSLRIRQPEEGIDLDKAKYQHSMYVAELKKLIPTVIEVPADDRFPDQVYVEEPAVILDGVALLTKMAPSSRAGEIEPMRKVLETMNLEIVEMEQPDTFLDGGDVLFTGREFFVGLSERTNEAGVKKLSEVFAGWPVTGVKVNKGILHLKSMCSIAGIDLIAISESQGGKRAWNDIDLFGTYKYKKLLFPDDNGANCLFVNGKVLHPAKEDYPKSYDVWKTLDGPKVEVVNSEFAKSDGSLTCNSIRVFEV